MVKQAVIINSYACNLRCRFCEYGDRDRELSLSRDDLELIADNYKPEKVNIMGGEPLLSPNLEHALELFPKVTVQTNGLLVKEKIELLKKAHSVIISVEGKKSYHDSIRGRDTWKKAVEAAKLLKNHVPVFLRANLSRENMNQIEYLISLSRRVANGLYFFPMIGNSHFSPNEAKQIFELLSEHENVWLDLPSYFCYLGVGGKCAAGESRLAFFPTRTIGPCQWMDWYHLGTLDDEPSLVLENARSFSRTKFPPLECSTCEFSDKCKGGCLVVRVPCPLSRTIYSERKEKEKKKLFERGRELKRLLSGTVTC